MVLQGQQPEVPEQQLEVQGQQPEATMVHIPEVALVLVLGQPARGHMARMDRTSGAALLMSLQLGRRRQGNLVQVGSQQFEPLAHNP